MDNHVAIKIEDISVGAKGEGRKEAEATAKEFAASSDEAWEITKYKGVPLDGNKCFSAAMSMYRDVAGKTPGISAVTSGRHIYLVKVG